MKDIEIKPPFNNYRELIKLIPSVQETILKGLERDRKYHVNNVEKVRIKANLYKEIFKLLQGKWTIEILYSLLMFRTCNFNTLKSALPGINSRTLTDRLKFLEQRGIVSREVLTESPIRVEYGLTKFGKESIILLIPFINYFILPPSIKKQLRSFKSIENEVRNFIAQEIEKSLH
ncbi:MAG: winged helix-turn-helix transcriptional regulator [Promethearchaeota archaeon]